MRVLSWNPSERAFSSHRLGFCAGMWSWDALTSSLKYQCCLLTFACRLIPPGSCSPCVCIPGATAHHNARVVFDPTYPSVDTGTFIKTDWKSMYVDVKEMIPSDAPVSRGKEVDMRLFVDSDHAGEQYTRRSRTGFVIYEHGANCVVLQASSKCGVKCLCSGVCCNEEWD
jgi:hypothetical protein